LFLSLSLSSCKILIYYSVHAVALETTRRELENVQNTLLQTEGIKYSLFDYNIYCSMLLIHLFSVRLQTTLQEKEITLSKLKSIESEHHETQLKLNETEGTNILIRSFQIIVQQNSTNEIGI
jgi:hypothetical protein